VRFRPPAYLLGILAALGVVLIVALGVRYFIRGVGKAVQTKVASRGESASQPDSSVRSGTLDARSDFDLSVDPGSEPLGLTWGDGEFLLSNRAAPAFSKFKPQGDSSLVAVAIDARESSQESLPLESFAIRAVTWNGKQYVGYADDSAPERSHKNVFTVHDPKTLAVTDYFPAPERIGGGGCGGFGCWGARGLRSVGLVD